MPSGEIVIEKQICQGCGFCVYFCNRGCLSNSSDEFTLVGNPLPVFSDPDKCNACGVCSWLCPACAIEVYKYVE